MRWLLERPFVLAAGISVTVAAWFFCLSGYLGMTTESVLGNRLDVFFQSDCALCQHLIRRPHLQPRLAHPLAIMLTIGPVRLMDAVVRLTYDGAVADNISARAFCALVAGLGIAALLTVLVRRRGDWSPLLLLPVYLLATSQVINCLPEHFALSHGLLCATLAVLLTDWPLRRRLIALAVLTVLVGGVTTTNVIFPLGALLWCTAHEAQCLAGLRALCARHRLALTTAAVLLAVAVGGAGLALLADVRQHPPTRSHVWQYMHCRLAWAPASAVPYALRGLIDPVIGPTPHLVAHPLLMVTYEPTADVPYRAWPYDLWQGVAVAAWLILLVAGTFAALRSPATRNVALGLLAWVAFNALLHNVFGDEYFLYTPHWSFALFALTWLALPARAWLIPVVGVLCVGQIHTLLAIQGRLALIAS